MHHNTLADVGKKALDDPAFWRDLQADPAAALAHAGLSLEPADMSALEEALRSNRLVVDLKQFMEAVHGSPGRPLWSGRWPTGRWPGRWPPFS